MTKHISLITQRNDRLADIDSVIHIVHESNSRGNLVVRLLKQRSIAGLNERPNTVVDIK